MVHRLKSRAPNGDYQTLVINLLLVLLPPDVTAVDGFRWGCGVEPGTHPVPVPLFRVHVSIPFQPHPNPDSSLKACVQRFPVSISHTHHRCWVPAARVCGSACLTVSS
jgi:hypothetical protein